jgi:flagellar motor switch protein FliN/FliY
MSDTEPEVVLDDEPDAEPVADAVETVVDAETQAVADADLGELAGPLVEADTMWDEQATPVAARQPSTALDPVLEVPVSLVVELGRTRMTIGETLRIGRGSIVSLDKDAGEPADLLVNGQLIARGEVVAIDEEFGLRVTEVVSPERRLEAGRS